MEVCADVVWVIVILIGHPIHEPLIATVKDHQVDYQSDNGEGNECSYHLQEAGLRTLVALLGGLGCNSLVVLHLC